MGLGPPRRSARGQAFNPWISWLSLIAALWLAAYAGTSHLLENRFHPDEAHYAAFARLIASGPGRGLLLSHIVVDKPPLSFYVNGLGVALIGPSELALRLPALLCSVVSVALIYALGKRLYGTGVAHAAAWAMALSPMAAQFAITAFVDPLMNMLVLAALTVTAGRRTTWAAAAIGLAFATKQTAVFAVPLVLALAIWRLPRPIALRSIIRQLIAAGVPILIGLAIVVMLTVAWDARRGAPISIWEQGYSDNVGGRAIALSELRPRADAILFLLWHMSGSTVINTILLVGLALVFILDVRRPSRAGGRDLLLVGYVTSYILVFWLVPFNLWDRYFVPLLPLIALLAGRAAVLLYGLAIRAFDLLALMLAPTQAGFWRKMAQIALPLLVLAIVVPRLITANYDFSPIGGDHGAYDGIDETAAFIKTLPAESILFDHWLGWEFEYYLFERHLPIVWFPDMPTFERNLVEAPATTSLFLAAPWWAPAAELSQAAERAGKRLEVVHQSYRRDGLVSVTVYKIAP